MKQVIYIALYPLPSSEKIKRKNGNPLSPIKLQMQKQRDDSWPSPTSRPLAIALLHALVATNSPASLLRGLPHYAYVNIDGAKDVDPFQNQKSEADDKHDDMSPLQPEIHRIFPNLKDIWGLLAKDLIKRKQYDLGRRITNDSDDEDDKENTIASRTVGPYAWPVLEWFISVFEKDQENHGGEINIILNGCNALTIVRQIFTHPSHPNTLTEDAKRPAVGGGGCHTSYPIMFLQTIPERPG